jgi:hypothetical protein
MKNLAFLFFFLTLISCKEEENQTYFTPEIALGYFKGIEEICNIDDGRLWGENLYAPIMFVDRKSRRITANQPDNDGILKARDGIFTGLYPKELIISNTPAIFGGTLFALVPLPDEEDDYRIKARALHSLFHRFQKNFWIISPSYNTIHMDEKEARLWLKLEWKALKKAVYSEGIERRQSVRDALIFNGARREMYPRYTSDENRFESYEGFSTFTYTILCTNSCEEFKEKLFEIYDRIYAMQSYARSYGFIHGALYASLLYDIGYNLHSIKTDHFDPGKTVMEQYNIELPAVCRDVAGSLAVNYEIDAIKKEEEKRLSDIKESIDKEISIFTEKPVVFIELESPYFDFEPEDIHSLGTMGTLYNTMRVSDSWGKLSVDEGGCLVSNNYKYIRITAKGFKADKNRISGEGWTLLLMDDWELVKVDQNYILRKLMP